MNKIDNYFLQNKPIFILGAAKKDQFYINKHCNVAFIGRSNVGKSSLINSITNTRISKTSKNPGKTKEINFFEIDKNLVFADLPGYGFANTSKIERERWHNLIMDYLLLKKSGILFLLLDIRRGITAVDFDFIQMLENLDMECQIIATKIDTVNKINIEKSLETIKLEIIKYNFIRNEILTISNSKNYGISKVREVIYDLRKQNL